MTKILLLVACFASLAFHALGFSMPQTRTNPRNGVIRSVPGISATSLFVNDDNKKSLEVVDPNAPTMDPMEDTLDEMDELTRKQMEKAQKAQLLREQEVFMKKSTGIHKCTNCDWAYDETKGDSMMIGGMIKPGTKFQDLPADWRCPVCRASKDAFAEVVEEIPGFEVNQGYGFGTNSWTAGQKNLAIFGGLGLFFLLFLSGYAMS
ncbi:rubredoxin-type FeCys4 protein [Nitzschia inconspicua]|uniref:Rubredoxin-type FeCys4 protein n=1 Tax=Nitzschia inconspicua TaxID=303405 RepID=A0A9K3LIQ3_9STRA|nr:rubredoxin-type FeCys4 protein [Nitzschia inconspicua]